MKTIIYTQLRTILKKKVYIFLTSIIALYFLLQGLRLRQYLYIYELKGNALDFLFFTIGGWESPTLFSFILSWLFLILSLIYISVISTASIEKCGVMIINRIQSRIKLWTTICIAQFLLSLIFLGVMVIGYFIVSYMLFDFNFNFSSYTFEFYESWSKSNISLRMIVFFISIIFTSGLYSLFMLMQVILNLSLNKQSLYIGFIFLAIATAIFYVYTDLPRIFSIIFYPSTLSIEFDINRILLTLVYHIIISTTCMIIGGFIYRKKDFMNQI